MVLIGHLVAVRQINVNINFLDLATFGVSIFLFLSGFGLYKSCKANGMGGFFKRRFTLVYVPFAISTIFIGLYKGFFDAHFVEILKTITFLNPSLPIDGTMWYIYFIAMWYIIFFAVFSFFKNDLLRLVTLFIVSCLIYKIPLAEEYEVLTFLFPFHAFTFTIGVAVGMCRPVNRKTLFVLGVICMSVFGYLFSYHFIKYDAMNHIMTAMVSAPAFVFLLASINVRFKPLAFIGGISYEIYLFEGVLRRTVFSENKLVSCIIFFLLVGCIAYSFRAFMTMIFSVKKNQQPHINN